ncbi:MAG TPA: hypothetical protein VFH01_07740 [Pyrinomonadaceae bacterium]|nr:hypothetical protein [Pyrinomonadaceae bacterium]
MRIKSIAISGVVFLFGVLSVSAQQTPSPSSEQAVPLTQTAVALDGRGTPAVEGTLRTTSLNGAPDTPVTNIRVVIKNVSPSPFSYVSGLVTFYDGSGIRCGEGTFKADEVLANESVETDAPGIRIRCAPANWRIVATNLLPRLSPGLVGLDTASRSANLIISVDGEEHPIQLDRPMVLTLGERQRTIIVRQIP